MLKVEEDIKEKLEKIYRILFDRYGKQHWWPVESREETIIGAILTQNTNWKNVEKALVNLRKNNLLDFRRLHSINEKELASLIRSSGYYNQKSKKIKNFVEFLSKGYGLDLDDLFRLNVDSLRTKLLKINGIGKETADSIILYAANKPIFVVDTYTKRIMDRIGFKEDSYDKLQELFMKNLSKDVEMFNEYHALLVRLGKEICKKEPLCKECCLNRLCCYYSDRINKNF